MSWEIQKLYYLKGKLLFSSISGGPRNLSKYLFMSVGILTLQVRRYQHNQILLECQAGKVLQHGKYQAHSGKVCSILKEAHCFYLLHDPMNITAMQSPLAHCYLTLCYKSVVGILQYNFLKGYT